MNNLFQYTKTEGQGWLVEKPEIEKPKYYDAGTNNLMYPTEKRSVESDNYEYEKYLKTLRRFKYDYPDPGKEMELGKDFEVNAETGKAYPLKKEWKDYPHLVEMEAQVKKLTPGTVQYWKQRCNFLEKQIDPTYTVFERDNCFMFYRILVNKEK